MKWIAFLMVAIMCITLCAVSQPYQYSTQTTGGAPTPISPTSPDALGLQAPSVTSSQQAPTPQEKSQGLIKVDQQMAYSAPSGLGATATSPTYAKMIVPPGGTGTAPNSLYISYAPQTVASCNLYANLPMWLQTSSSGDICFTNGIPMACWIPIMQEMPTSLGGIKGGSLQTFLAGISSSIIAMVGVITLTYTYMDKAAVIG